MKRPILSLTLLAAASIPAAASITGQWFAHPSFDNSLIEIVDTPTRTYFMGYPQLHLANVPFKANTDCTLFYFDKEGEEVVAAAQRHDLSQTVVKKIAYNPDREYLMIIYDDQNIDMLRDDGSVSNIGALKNASITGSKAVNDVTFDPANNMAWLATDFGYVAINDENCEVAQSRNYGTAVSHAVRLGDIVYLATDGGQIVSAPFEKSRTSLDDYSETDYLPGTRFYPFGDNKVLIWQPKDGNESIISTHNVKGNRLETIEERSMTHVYYVQPAKEGCTITSYNAVALADKGNGRLTFQRRPEDEYGKRTGSTWDMQTIYAGAPRRGLRELKLNADKVYAQSRSYMRPNAPSAYYSRAMAYHPRYGMLVGSHGVDHIFSNTDFYEPNLLCGLKGGAWTVLNNVYRSAGQASVATNPLGLAIDPDDDRYVYLGSNFSGMTRLNLDDPNDIIHFSHPGDPNASLPGYVKIHDTSTGWARSSNFLAPQFDNDGTLWTIFSDYDDRDKMVFRYWPAADRKATKDASTARPWKTLSFRLNEMNHMQGKFIPLRASVNRNLIIYMGPFGMFVLDHNGTPDNPSDDKLQSFRNISDQDGNPIEFTSPNDLYEDPQTGVVWISSARGLLYCTPRNLLQGQAVLNRVKVSRNDGTSLADYLLNGVEVNAVARDGSNRMWIATMGAGIVVTSADGKIIYDEFSAENSPLPSNTVYYLGYNKENNSMMISTSKGLTEFLINGGSDTAGDSDKVRAYPNPVAPDYFGWVTIDGLPDNALVKIVDANGTIVRELGKAEGGSVQWDVNNLHYRRVKTGVYYILASSTAEGTKDAKVGKIMVMN